MVQVRSRFFRTIDVTRRHDFSINIEVNGEKQTAFQKTLISQGYTYKYILKLQKAQEKMLDKIYTPKLVECVNEILKLYNNLQRFCENKQSDVVPFMTTRWYFYLYE